MGEWGELWGQAGGGQELLIVQRMNPNKVSLLSHHCRVHSHPSLQLLHSRLVVDAFVECDHCLYSPSGDTRRPSHRVPCNPRPRPRGAPPPPSHSHHHVDLVGHVDVAADHRVDALLEVDVVIVVVVIVTVNSVVDVRYSIKYCKCHSGKPVKGSMFIVFLMIFWLCASHDSHERDELRELGPGCGLTLGGPGASEREVEDGGRPGGGGLAQHQTQAGQQRGQQRGQQPGHAEAR